jgi:hypothetical protein
VSQAVAAIKFADEINQKLVFHINGNRTEQNSNGSILKNTEALFKNSKHVLHKHEWMSHSYFLHVLKKLDISMQVSFTETFNIVSADAVYNSVPVVVSPTIHWASRFSKADPLDIDDICNKMYAAYDSNILPMWNKYWLKQEVAKNELLWTNLLFSEL